MKAMMRSIATTTLIACLLHGTTAQATEPPAFFTFQGRILKSNGTDPVEDNSVVFKIQLRSPDGLCLLFEETHLLDMSGTSGVFSLAIGHGSNTNATALSLKQVFENNTAKTGAAGCSYTPVSSDARRLRLSYETATETVSLPMDQTISSVPYAMNTQMLEGLGKNAFLQISPSATQTNADAVLAKTADILALVNGTAAQYAKASDLPVSGGVLDLTNGGLKIPAPASNDSAVNKNYADNKFGGMTLNLSAVTNGQSIAWNAAQNRWEASTINGNSITSGTIGGTTAINVSGAITTSGTVTAANVSSTSSSMQNIRLFDSNNAKKVNVSVPANLSSDYALVLPSNAGTSGQFLTTDGSGNLSWTVPVAATVVAAGAVQLASDNQSAAGLAVQANDSRLSNPRAPNGSAAGDLSGSYPSPVVAKIQGVAVSSAAPASGQLMKYNGTTWSAAHLGLTDLKSSVGGALFASPACSASQALAYSSVTDQFACQSISIAASQISGSIAAAQISGLGAAATLNVGATAGSVAAGDDSRFGNALNLRGRAISTTAPGTGQVMTWNNTSSQWEPVTLDWSKVNSGTPTTLAGYGITDAVKTSGSVTSLQAGADASKPSAGTSGRIYFATDSQKIYRDNGSTWEVLASAAGNGGTVTNVSVSAPLTVSNASSTPALALQAGTSAGQTMTWNGSAWTAATPNISQLRNASAATQFPTTCTAAQTLTYQSASDTFVCSNIAIAGSQVSGNLPASQISGNLPSSQVSGLGGAAAMNVGTASGSVAAGDDARFGNATKLSGTSLSLTSVSNGQALVYNSATSKWENAAVGSVTSVVAGNGLVTNTITSTGTLDVDTGTAANKIVKLDSQARLPAVDGSQLSNLPIPFTNMQTFDSNGTFNVPAGTTKVFVQVWGAGGGGAGGSNVLTSLGGGAGGGGGGFASGFVTVASGGSVAVVIGAGGAGGAVATAGTAGGTTSFGSAVSITGGAAGSVGGTIGILGGVASALSAVVGGRGGPILGSIGGAGGNGAGGGGQGGWGSGTASNTATAGASPGGGGGGGYGASLTGSAGGNGANGRVIVFY